MTLILLSTRSYRLEWDTTKYSKCNPECLGPSNGGSIPSNPPVTSAPLPTQTTTDPDDIIYNDNDEFKPVHETHDPITDPYSSEVNKPGQYLIASHPWFGTYTQHLSGFADLNPFKAHEQIRQEVKEFLGELLSFRR